MPDFDRGDTLADRFRTHAGEERHLYAVLMRAMAEDLDARGVVWRICEGAMAAPEGAAIQLRLLAGVFRIVLSGRADELKPFYPVLGGSEEPGGAWAVMEPVLRRNVTELQDALAVAPQTNEPGRCVALFVGLSSLVADGLHPEVDLRELGASAGLNLLLPHVRITGDNWSVGPPGSPLRFERPVEGDFAPQPFSIATAAGCDVAPLDPVSSDDALRLRSFVWPFHLHRHARLDAALRLAGVHGPQVFRASADAWIRDALTAPHPVVWHSITRQYWPPEVVARVERALAEYGADRPLGRVALEYDRPGKVPVLSVDHWPGDGTRRTRVVATVHFHGVPVRMLWAAGPDHPRGGSSGDSSSSLASSASNESGSVT